MFAKFILFFVILSGATGEKIDVSKCGKDFQCLTIPSKCTTNCEVIGTYRYDKTKNIVEYQLWARNNLLWVALGQKPPADENYMLGIRGEYCYKQNSKVKLGSFNGNDLDRATDPVWLHESVGKIPGLKLKKTSLADNGIYCSYERPVSTKGNKYLYDLSKPNYAALTSGDEIDDNNNPEYHGYRHYAKSGTLQIAPKSASTNEEVDLSKCEKDYKCIRKPAGCKNDCIAVIAYHFEPTKNTVVYQMWSSQKWIAIGQKPPTIHIENLMIRMRGEFCQREGSEIQFGSFNGNKLDRPTHPVYVLDSHKRIEGVKLIKKHANDDGSLFCSYERPVLSSSEFLYDLSKPLRAAIGYGNKVGDDGPGYHGHGNYHIVKDAVTFASIPPAVVDLSKCGKNYKCIRQPSNCDKDCIAVLAYRFEPTKNTVVYQLWSSQKWIAIGQKPPTTNIENLMIKMRGEYCYKQGSSVNFGSFNGNQLDRPTHPVWLPNSHEKIKGLKLLQVNSNSDGSIFCSYERPVSSPSEFMYDLSKPLRTAIGYGNRADDDGPGYHGHGNYHMVNSPITFAPSPPIKVDLSKCGKNYKCIRQPGNCDKDCIAVVAYHFEPTKNTVVYQMWSSQKWIAIGQKPATTNIENLMIKMRGEFCYKAGSSVYFGSFNGNQLKRPTHPVWLPNSHKTIKALTLFFTTANSDGSLYCSYERPVSSSSEFMYDLSKPLRAAIGYGNKVERTGPGYHGNGNYLIVNDAITFAPKTITTAREAATTLQPAEATTLQPAEATTTSPSEGTPLEETTKNPTQPLVTTKVPLVTTDVPSATTKQPLVTTEQHKEPPTTKQIDGKDNKVSFTGKLEASACGVGFSCFLHPKGCTSHCLAATTFYFEPQRGRVVVKLWANKGQRWVGFGQRPKQVQGNYMHLLRGQYCLRQQNGSPKLGSFNGNAIDENTPSAPEWKDKVKEVKLRRTGTNDDGSIYCEFERPVNSTGEDMYNISTSLAAAIAYGKVTRPNGDPGYHTAYSVSKDVNFLNIVKINSEESNLSSKKVHGILMTIAWLFLCTCGIFMSRYMKPVLKQSICSKDAWFRFHQLGMSLCVILSLAAFIVIVLDVQGWSKNAGKHHWLGLFTFIMALLQPIMAFFRCDPSHNLRYLFTWGHRLIGIAAWAVGVAAVCTGLEHLSIINTPAISFAVIVVVLFLLTDVIRWRLNKRQSNNRELEKYPMKSVSSLEEELADETKPENTNWLYFLFFAITSVLAALVTIYYIQKIASK